MHRCVHWKARLLVAGAAPLLGLAGCFARLEDGLELVFASGATANALRLPSSPLLPLAELFIRAWYG
jgi:hypothetical protein